MKSMKAGEEKDNANPLKNTLFKRLESALFV